MHDDDRPPNCDTDPADPGDWSRPRTRTITEADIDVTHIAARLRRYSRLERGATLIIQNPEDRWDYSDERPDYPLPPQPLPSDTVDIGPGGAGDIWNNP